MESHREIEEHAAALLAKRDSGDWSAQDQASLAQWMEASTAHRIAVLRLQSAWEKARRLRAVGAGLPSGMIPAPGDLRQTPFFRDEEIAGPQEVSVGSGPEDRVIEEAGVSPSGGARARKYAAIAAAVVVAIAAGSYFYVSGTFTGERYATKVGAMEIVPLDDGSNITLNTASKLRVAMSGRAREVQLERGEAYFDVAADPTRPFIVSAANRRIVVLGTKFSVRRDRDELEIVVTEGKVAISGSEAGPTSGSASDTKPTRSAQVLVSAGSIAHASGDNTVVKETTLAEVEESLSWRSGFVVFHETALGDAVAELNRYNTHKIAIDDPTLAAVRISGTFRPTNYQAFVRLLETGFSIHAVNREGSITLTK